MIPKENRYYIVNDNGFTRILYLTSVIKIEDEDREYEIKGILLCGFDDTWTIWWGDEVNNSQGDIEDLECGNSDMNSIKPSMIIKKLFK